MASSDIIPVQLFQTSLQANLDTGSKIAEVDRRVHQWTSDIVHKSMHKMKDYVDEKLYDLVDQTINQMDGLKENIDAEVQNLVNQTCYQLDGLERYSINPKFDAVNARIDSLNKTMTSMVIGVSVVTVVISSLAYAIGRWSK